MAVPPDPVAPSRARTLLVPVFFVLMGMRADLRPFVHPQVLGLAAPLALAAFAGKQARAVGGWGAAVDRATVAAVVIMVVLTARGRLTA